MCYYVILTDRYIWTIFHLMGLGHSFADSFWPLIIKKKPNPMHSPLLGVYKWSERSVRNWLCCSYINNYLQQNQGNIT